MFCCILKGKYYASNRSQNQVSKFCQLVGHGPTYPGLVVCKDLVNARTRRKCWIVLFVVIQKLYVFTAAVYGELAARMGGAWGTCFCLMVTNCISWIWICLLVGIGVVLRRRNNKSEFVQKTSTAKGYQRIWTEHWEDFYSCAESIYFMNFMILGLASISFLNQQENFDVLHT